MSRQQVDCSLPHFRRWDAKPLGATFGHCAERCSTLSEVLKNVRWNRCLENCALWSRVLERSAVRSDAQSCNRIRAPCLNELEASIHGISAGGYHPHRYRRARTKDARGELDVYVIDLHDGSVAGHRGKGKMNHEEGDRHAPQDREPDPLLRQPIVEEFPWHPCSG